MTRPRDPFVQYSRQTMYLPRTTAVTESQSSLRRSAGTDKRSPACDRGYELPSLQKLPTAARRLPSGGVRFWSALAAPLPGTPPAYPSPDTAANHRGASTPERPCIDAAY